ncbi:MAG: protein-disulfide reductase DsbD family protein [Alphaproteobacteria bacterium]|nr:protein-disulfide reductase DsbD family protein [Alphaproteobacteria bacterium]
MTKKIRSFALCFVAVLTIGLAMTLPSQAFEGQWVELPNAKARLLATGDPMSGHILAGLEIELDEDWKTYWRFPGDSGIPPNFDWSGAQNVAGTQLLFPAPQRFTDEYGQSVGYKHRVVFPIEIELEGAGRSTNLELDIVLGICREVCIPVMERFSLKLPPIFVATEAAKTILNAATETVPMKVDEAQQPEIKVTERVGTTPVVTVSVPTMFLIKDIFIEGPDTWFLSLPEKLPANDADQLDVWQLPLDGTPIGKEPWGAAMRLTMVGTNESFEQEFVLTAPE